MLVVIGKTLVAVGAGWLVVTLIMFTVQRSLIYKPDPSRPALDAFPVAGLVEVTVATADGLALAAWHAPARPGRPTVLFLHGNAGNRGALAHKAAPYVAAGYGLLLLDYRGYGGNPGQPTEAGLVEDARAARAFLLGQGVAAEALIYHGESLGTGVAVALALEAPPRALVLESPFTALPDVGARQYPWLPVRLAMRDRFPIADRIARVAAPLLVLHGEDDRLIPADHGRTVHAAHGGPKALRLYPRGRHADLYDHGAGADILAWLAEHAG